MLVTDMIEFWARSQPLHPAMVTPEAVVTYKGLSQAIASVRARIARLGLEPGERIAVDIDQPAQMYVVSLALMKSGFIAAPISDPTIPHLKSAGVKRLICDRPHFEPGLQIIRVEAGWFSGAPAAPEAAADASLQAIFFTSGSTGAPKAGLCDFIKQTVWYDYWSFVYASVPWTRALVMPGLGSHFGFKQTCFVLMQGKTAYFAPNQEQALRLISYCKIEFVVASTGQAAGLVNCPAPSMGNLDSVRAIMVSGARMTKQLVRDLRDRLCRQILSVYSSTEASTAAFAVDFAVIEDIPDAVGFLAPWAELEVVDERGNLVPAGHTGMIRYRTQSHLSIISDHSSLDDVSSWFYPGDIGSVTADNVLCIHGRTDNRLNLGGVKVSAELLDEIVQGLPGVQDGAVCALPGADGVDELGIALVCKGPRDEAGVRKTLQARRFNYRIARIVYVERIPRSVDGKLMRGPLRNVMMKPQA